MVPTLVQFAKVRIAICLWTKYQKKIFKGYELKDIWEEHINKVEESAVNLIVSNQILQLTDMKDTVYRVGYELKQFCDQLRQVNIFPDIDPNLLEPIWSGFGLIIGVKPPKVKTGFFNQGSFRKTWKKLVQSSKVRQSNDLKHRLTYLYIYCMYCDEPNIVKIWHKLSVEEQGRIEVHDFMVGYWVGRMKNFCMKTLMYLNPQRLYEWEGSWDDNRSPTVFLWRLAALTNNRTAAMFFFNQMTSDERMCSITNHSKYIEDDLMYTMENLQSVYAVGVIPYLCGYLQCPCPGINVETVAQDLNPELYPALCSHLAEGNHDQFRFIHIRILSDLLDYSSVAQKEKLVDRSSALLTVLSVMFFNNNVPVLERFLQHPAVRSRVCQKAWKVFQTLGILGVHEHFLNMFIEMIELKGDPPEVT